MLIIINCLSKSVDERRLRERARAPHVERRESEVGGVRMEDWIPDHYRAIGVILVQLNYASYQLCL